MVLVQEKLIRIITCSPYRAHTEPLLFANRIMTLSDINTYMTGAFMYQWVHKNIPNIFQNFFHTNRTFHCHDTRHAHDFCVPNHRIEIRKCNMKVHGVKVWASCQIRKIAGAHAPGMPGTFSPSPQVSDPDMHHGTCVTHVPWCMPGSLTIGFLWNRRRGKTFPAFPAHAQPAIYVSGKRPMEWYSWWYKGFFIYWYV